MAAAANDNVTVKHWSRHKENRRKENEHVIAREVKSTVKELLANEMATLVEKALHDAVHNTFHRTQRGVLSVSKNAFEQVISDFLRKDFIGETLDVSRRLLTSTSFMAQIATFVRRETATAMKDRIYSTVSAPKGTCEYHNDV